MVLEAKYGGVVDSYDTSNPAIFDVKRRKKRIKTANLSLSLSHSIELMSNVYEVENA